MSDQAPRIHQPCGQPMARTVFGKSNPTPQYRSQPIWTCGTCNAWEPAEGWDGPLPGFYTPDPS